MREGAALLQGIAKLDVCGRGLRVYYRGLDSAPGYYCAGSTISNGRGERCLQIGGRQVDDAVAEAFLAELAPAGLEAALKAAEQIESDHDGVLAQFKREVERAEYEAQRAERRYRAVDPENRLVARGLEAEWEQSLRQLETSRAELTRREQRRPRALGAEERATIRSLGSDLKRVWSAPTTSDRDRKELLRALLEEVIIVLQRHESCAHLTMRWCGGAITQLDIAIPRFQPMGPRTDEDIISLLRRVCRA